MCDLSERTDENLLQKIRGAEEVFWMNPLYGKKSGKETKAAVEVEEAGLTEADVNDAAARLERFGPYICRNFPETLLQKGLIESPLKEISGMKKALCPDLEGRLFLKMDSHLAIAGSVKARGGIYEILRYAESLAMENGLLRTGDSYEILDSEKFRKFFSRYTVQVGSTGNLGMSIGIISAALGFRVTVHMSQDAKEWKKQILRENLW